MKKLAKFKFINIFLTAVLTLNQAIFLFSLAIPSQAQTMTDKQIDTTTNITTEIDTISDSDKIPIATDLEKNLYEVITPDILDYKPEDFVITFREAYQPPFAGEKRITVSLNQEINAVDFRVEGPRNSNFAGIRESSKQYYFIWNTPDFPNGYYKITAKAILAGEVKASRSFNGQVINEISSDNLLLQPTDKFYPEEIKKPLEQFILKPPPVVEIFPKEVKEPLEPFILEQPPVVEIFPKCEENNIDSIDGCRKFINVQPECRKKGLFSQEECNKYMSTPPECRQQGLFSREECDKYMSTPPECRGAGISDKERCEKYMYRDTMPLECQKAGVTTPEECRNIIFLEHLPSECQRAGVSNKEECDKILKAQMFLTLECKQAKIIDRAECDKYMMEKFMAPECGEAGVTTSQECDYILRDKAVNLGNLTKVEFRPPSKEFKEEFKYFEEKYELPPECKEAGAKTPEECSKIMFFKQAPTECQKANIRDPEECKKHMMLLSAPEDCREAGVSDKEECEKILFKKHAPKECLEVGISTPEKCEKYMFEKSAPPDCREAGILTTEACKKYMFEKYSGEEEIPVDKFPIECQKAEAKTLQECDKVMKKMYMPRECQDQGITDEKKCDFYMQQKYMPRECQEAGAKTRSECDKIMFKKFGLRECLEAGIEDEGQCEDFMFNRYAPRVICQGIDDWQCKNSIKERHLGNIVAKQVKFRELEERVAHLAGESITMEELKASLDIAKEMIPIREGTTGLRILAMEKKLILDDSDNLIQTTPIALMIDSDQDGLPDEMEKRFGTDPKKADTDGDGYDDGVEIENNYNPLGQGNYNPLGREWLKKSFSPIGQAIIGNKKIEQPKTDGEISEDLIVESIDNILDEQDLNKGYILKGKAKPDKVITLYIYSDLPLVATVKTDEYGNWQYELNQSLIEGEHEVYVALNDNTGKIIAKSNPLNFFIKEAKAISVKDFISDATPVVPASQTASLVKYYIIAATLIIIVGILLFVLFIIQKKKQSSRV